MVHWLSVNWHWVLPCWFLVGFVTACFADYCSQRVVPYDGGWAKDYFRHCVLFPYYTFYAEEDEDIKECTVFWGRGYAVKLIGYFFITLGGPLRATLSLLGWIFRL